MRLYRHHPTITTERALIVLALVLAVAVGVLAGQG